MSPKNIQIPMNPFCAKNLKTNYNVTPYGDHGIQRVNLQDSDLYVFDGLFYPILTQVCFFSVSGFNRRVHIL
jgi:hypothetical protein